MNNNLPQVTVNAKGKSDSAFTRATLSATVTGYGPSGPDAKKNATEAIAALRRVLVQNATEGGIDLDRMATSFAVSPNMVYQNSQQVFQGYKATYEVSFSCSNVVGALTIHDKITNIPGVVSPTPVFHLDNQGEVAAAAFKDAYETARKKFEAQCEAVGDKFALWTLAHWSIADEEPRGKMLTFNANAGSLSAVGAEPGKALFEVRVHFVFMRMAPPGRGSFGV